MLNRADWQIPAGEMYQGQYWSIIRAIKSTLMSKGSESKLLIASAGLGLLSENDHIPAYSATFQSGAHDDILALDTPPLMRRLLVRTWWQEVNLALSNRKKYTNLMGAVTHNTRTVICLLSSLYLEGLREDILSIESERPDIEFLIFTPRNDPTSRGLRGAIAIESNLQKKLGGGCVSLNARMALEYLNSKRRIVSITSTNCRNFFKRFLRKHGVKCTLRRIPVKDATIRAFIRNELNSGKSYYSPALREFRDCGYACEMKRFRRLFNEVKNHG